MQCPESKHAPTLGKRTCRGHICQRLDHSHVCFCFCGRFYALSMHHKMHRNLKSTLQCCFAEWQVSGSQACLTFSTNLARFRVSMKCKVQQPLLRLLTSQLRLCLCWQIPSIVSRHYHSYASLAGAAACFIFLACYCGFQVGPGYTFISTSPSGCSRSVVMVA